MLARGRWHPPTPTNLGRRVLAIGSTGGRVGKSTIAAHLGMAMANLGAQVILVDLDLRAPVLHRLLGAERPTLGWQALLAAEIQTLDSSLARTTIRNLHLVGGGTLREGARGIAPIAIDGDQKSLLVQHLRALEADVVILDLGATNHDELADFFSLAETGLLVSSPRHSSLAATLAFLGRGAPAAREDPPRVAPPPPAVFSGKIIGNRASTLEDVEILHAFSRLVRARLSTDLPVVGCVHTQDRLARLVPGGREGPQDGGVDGNGRTFLRMAELLLHEEIRGASGDPAARLEAGAGAATTGAARQGERAAHGPASAIDPDESLARALDRYRRKHLRHEVDWAATLKIGAREIAVRVVEVSFSGAALEVVSALELDAPAMLRFDQLPGQPTLPAVIKSLIEPIRRAGVAFTGAEEARGLLVAAAEAQGGRADALDEPEPIDSAGGVGVGGGGAA
jgi:MinD-like ATPase involved in chromosome partitioning or flagellar assembly